MGSDGSVPVRRCPVPRIAILASELDAVALRGQLPHHVAVIFMIWVIFGPATFGVGGAPPTTSLPRLEEPNGREEVTQPPEILDVARVDSVTPLRRGRHDDGIDRRRPLHGSNGLARESCQLARQRLDDHAPEDVFADGATATPPLCDDIGGNDRHDAQLVGAVEHLPNALTPSLERNERASIESDRAHVTFRRFLVAVGG